MKAINSSSLLLDLTFLPAAAWCLLLLRTITRPSPSSSQRLVLIFLRLLSSHNQLLHINYTLCDAFFFSLCRIALIRALGRALSWSCGRFSSNQRSSHQYTSFTLCCKCKRERELCGIIETLLRVVNIFFQLVQPDLVALISPGEASREIDRGITQKKTEDDVVEKMWISALATSSRAAAMCEISYVFISLCPTRDKQRTSSVVCFPCRRCRVRVFIVADWCILNVDSNEDLKSLAKNKKTRSKIAEHVESW